MKFFSKLINTVTILTKGVNSYNGTVPLLISAIRNNNLDYAEQIIKLGADVNIKAHADRTALMFLSECETNIEVVHKTKEEQIKHNKDIKKILHLLCDKGADMNAKDDYDNTAMTFATNYDADTVFWGLYERGVDLSNLKQGASILESIYNKGNKAHAFSKKTFSNDTLFYLPEREHKKMDALLNGQNRLKFKDDNGDLITNYIGNETLKTIIEAQYLNTIIEENNKPGKTFKV